MLRITNTENGTVRGIPAADNRITAFKGIPFAAPPIGENRWRAPQPCPNWEGTLDAGRFAPISMQDTPGIGDIVYNREWHVDPEIPMSEDCLYLNIWTNAMNSNERKPVVVWFFGGAFQWGYTSEMEFDGERLARRDVVAVTVGYRLNSLGFLAHPELTKEQPDAPTNFGLLDQQAALRWVKRNITNFGGDPKNITIAGQSAGGGSVMTHLTSPTNAGLFQKAIVHSAMIKSAYPNMPSLAPISLQEAEEAGKRFFTYLGVEHISEARKLDALFIREKYAEYMKDYPFMMTVVDNKFCFGDPSKLFALGKYPDIPVMTGNTLDEFPHGIMAENEEDLIKQAKEIFGEDAEKFLSMPETHKKTEVGFAPVSCLEPIIRFLLVKSKESGQKANTYYYQFDAEIPGDDHPGTFHSVDLWFFWDTLYKCIRPYRGRHYDLARHMCTYWCNFVKTGDPNGNDDDGTALPLWRPYTKDDPATIVFCTDKPEYITAEYSEFIHFTEKWVGRKLLEE